MTKSTTDATLAGRSGGKRLAPSLLDKLEFAWKVIRLEPTRVRWELLGAHAPDGVRPANACDRCYCHIHVDSDNTYMAHIALSLCSVSPALLSRLHSDIQRILDRPGEWPEPEPANHDKQ